MSKFGECRLFLKKVIFEIGGIKGSFDIPESIDKDNVLEGMDKLTDKIVGISTDLNTDELSVKTVEFFDRFEKFLADNFQRTDIENVSPLSKIEADIRIEEGDLLTQSHSGFNGLVRTLDEVPDELRGMIKNRAQALAYLVIEAFAMFIEYKMDFDVEYKISRRLGGFSQPVILH